MDAPQAPGGYLTPHRHRTLAFVADWIDSEGYAPSVREITAGMGLASPSTVHAQLAALRSQGYVVWRDGLNRTLQVTAEGREALQFRH